MTNKIPFSDWEKVDLRVGKIIKVEDHPDADKLYVLTVDLGEKEPRTIVAGLKNHYKKEELENKQGIFIANLESVKLRGIESNGMTLAVSDENNVFIIQPEKEIQSGTKVK